MESGQRISHFEIVELLGKGGMGVVYKARDLDLGRPVALKFLHAHADGDEESRERFRIEARAASALDHPNICGIYEIGETENGSLFIAMAYYEGETLDDVMSGRSIELEEAIEIVTAVANGLDAAHEAGIVHRDIKPANIMLLQRGGVRILDFGLAKMQNLALTREGSTVGTAMYMSPEQLTGQEVDHRTDIWALGVLLYELVSGRKPFSGDYEQAVMYAVTNTDPDPLDEGPEYLATVIHRCLEKDPARRFQSAADVVEAVRSRSPEAIPPSKTRTPTAERSTPGSFLRKKTPVVVLATIVGAIAIVLASLFWFRGEALPSSKHIAVLPFVNVGDPSNQSFVDGLVHAVSSQIANMEQFQGELWVVPATDVFRRHITTSDEAASKLHVNLALTGSVWKTDEILQLTLNLVDAASGRLLRTALLESSASDVSKIQAGVVERVAGLIEVELRPEQEEYLTAGATTVPGAYEFYIRALGYLSRYQNESDVGRALGLFKRAIMEDSSYALGFAGLGEAYWRRYDASNDPADADSALTFSHRALELDDRLPAVQNTIGHVFLGTGRYDEAEAAFRKTIEIDPKSDIAHRDLGRTLEALGRGDDAESSYLTAIRVQPDYWANYNELGAFYVRRNEFNKAIEQFEQVVILAPENPWGYNNLAVAHEQLGLTEEAEKLYRQATTANPSAVGATALAYYNLGVLAAARDDFQLAVDLYSKSIEYLDTDFDAWGELGGAYHWLGLESKANRAWEESITLAQKSLEVNPLSYRALSRLALDHAKLGNSDSAEVFIDSLLSLSLVSSEKFLDAGSAYEILGERQRAITYLIQALDLGYPYASIEEVPWLDQIREDPAFQSAIRNRGE